MVLGKRDGEKGVERGRRYDRCTCMMNHSMRDVFFLGREQLGGDV